MACGGRVKLSDFWLNHRDASLFTKSQWPVPQYIFIIWRLFLALYLLGWVAAHLAIDGNIGSFYVFLTDWTYTVFTLYAVVSCMSTVYYSAARNGSRVGPMSSENPILSSDTDPHGYGQPYAQHDALFHSSHDFQRLLTSGVTGRPHRQESPLEGDSGTVSPHLPNCLKLVWLMFNMCLSLNPIITVVFWSLLVPPHQSALSWAFNINYHALNTVFIYADLLLSALPVRAAHFIYGFLYGFVYMSFSLIYYWAGGVNPQTGQPAIYPRVLDWSQPGRTVLSVLGVFAASLVTHLAGYGLYRLRVVMHTRCCANDKELSLPVLQA